MTTTCHPTIISLTLLAVVCSSSAGQDGTAPAAGKPEKLVLFDGKSLDGWKKADFYKAGEVKVDDGKIVMATGPSMTGITCTRPNLPTTNYEFSYEAMRIDGHDFFAAATFPVGKSFITLVNGGWGGNVTGLSSLDGMDASENDTTQSFRYQNKTWYRFRVRVTDKMIRCAIDGKEIVAVNYQDRRVGTRIETRRNQPLGFATWETSGAVRNIEVRPLADAEIAETDKFDQ
jgi:3-keto-disaccharide hydrolase